MFFILSYLSFRISRLASLAGNRLASGIKPATMSTRLAVVATVISAGIAVVPPAANAQSANLSLPDLESKLIASPALAAADSEIFSAESNVEYQYERGRGFNYFFSNDFGPRSDVVINTDTNRTIRYGQVFGVEFPLFGTRLTEHLELSEARSHANLTRIAAEAERRRLLGQLRASYIKFWQYDREQAIVANFVALQKAEAHSARTFFREGFWTQANYLGFLDGLAEFTTDLTTLRTERRSALADIRAIVNEDVPDRTPDTPDLSFGCSPSADEAVAVAAANDPDIARFQEEQNASTAALDFIKHSSINAAFRLGAGTALDIPQHALGYNVTGTFDISFPQHMRPQESARREAFVGEIQTARFGELQRRSELRAAVLNVLDTESSALSEYQLAKRENDTTRESLREARVREATIIGTGAANFNEVLLRITESYNAARKETSALGATYTGVNAIENLVPDACVPFRINNPYKRN